MDDLEDQLHLVLVGRDEQPLVDDQQRRVDVLLQGGLQRPRVGGCPQVEQHVGQPDVHGLVVVHARREPERAGQIRLAASRGPGDEDVAVLGDVLAACELEDQGLVELSAGAVVDVDYARVRLLEARLLDQALEPVVLAAVVFRVHDQAEAVAERKAGHRGVLLLDPELVGHGGQAHGEQLFHSAVVKHPVTSLRNGARRA